MRVLALTRYGRAGASSRVRLLQYLPTLRATGIDVTIKPLLGDGYVEQLYAGRRRVAPVAQAYLRRIVMLRDARAYDVVWVEKECMPWLPAWVELGLLPKRVPLVADYDDAWFHRYDQHAAPWVQRVLGGKIAAVMRRAALVTAGNPYLAEYARQAGASRVETLPTVVDLERYPMVHAKTQSDTVVVGWIGSPSTAPYLRMLSAPLEKLARRFALRCVAVGANPDQVRGTPFEAVPWREDTEAELIRSFDIGVMPLPDEPFERGKCGYKLIQYMACNLPVVASPVGVNNDIVQPGINGELAATPKDWHHVLEALVSDADTRQRMGRAGRRRIEDWYSLQVQAPRLVGFLNSLV